MISVLLIILKIVGIVLLVAISLILLLVLTVLLVPVRYRFKGSYDDKFLCKGKITWLLHLVSVHIYVEENAKVTVRILGIPLSLFKKKKEETDFDASSKKETTVSGAEKIVDIKKTVSEKKGSVLKATGSVQDEEVQSEKKLSSTEGNVSDEDETTSAIKEKASVMEDNVSATDAQDAEDKSSQKIFEKISIKIQDMIQKIKEVTEKVKSVFAKIKDVLVNIKEKKELLNRYLKILKSDTFKAAFATCKKSLGRMLKHILPNKMRVRIAYGLADPADTGYVLAVYGMLPEFIGKRIFLQPDFEQQIFNGDFNIKGAIRVWTLLYQVLRVLMDTNCRKLYHIVKKEIANEHK